MATPTEIHDLIERFERNIDSYRSPAYNEAQLRKRLLYLAADSHRFSQIAERSEVPRFAGSFLHALGRNPVSSFPILPFAFVPFTSRMRVLDLNKKLQAANIASEKTMIQRQIDATDRQIDKLVYEL